MVWNNEDTGEGRTAVIDSVDATGRLVMNAAHQLNDVEFSTLYRTVSKVYEPLRNTGIDVGMAMHCRD